MLIKEYVYKFFYFLFKIILRFVYFILYNPTIHNKEVIPTKGAAIIACNHIHMFDPCYLVISTKRMVHFLAKGELFGHWYSFFFELTGCIPVNREGKSPESIKEAIKYLKQGHLVGIYPEGTRKKDDSIILQPLKNGCIKMAKEANCPIIPCVLIGKYRVFRHDTHVYYGEPLYVNDLTYEDANKLLFDTMSKLITDHQN